MIQLSADAFSNAAEFIALNARPLERALFKHHFESGPTLEVLDELEKFRNPDGGFGHGIEPDLRLPLSSPFASSVAFQALRMLAVPGDQLFVKAGIEYFERTYDRSIGGWDPVGPQGDEFPHAPWWNYVPVDGQLDLLKKSNPGAEIAGYLHLYADQADPDFRTEVTAALLDTFEALPDDMEVHTMMCFMRLAELAPGPVADQILPKLKRGVHLVTDDTPDEWQNYGGRPLWFAPSPDSLLSGELETSIQAQLDYEIESQSEDGGWQPNWAWGPGQYESAWDIARVEWAGHLTLHNLVMLKAWGRI